MKLYSYLIDRYNFIVEKLKSATDKNAVLLRNGVIPEELQPELRQIEANASKDYPIVSFLIINSFNSYFELHPHKVLGKEIITSSREFPITIKGEIPNALDTIRKHIQFNKIIIPLPIGWRVLYATYSYSPFQIEYSSIQNDHLILEHMRDENVFALFHFKDGVLMSSHQYTSVGLANYHIVHDHLNKPLKKASNYSLLELEAFALEIELKLLKI